MELAKAYVQIIPTTDGIKDNITKPILITNKNIKASPFYILNFSTAVLSACSIVFLGSHGFTHSGGQAISPTFSNLCLYFIAPAIFTVSFLFLSTEKERKISHVFDGPILSVLFVVYSVIFATIRPNDFPDYYGIFNVNQFLPDRWYLILVIFIILMIGPFLLGILFFTINNKLASRAVASKQEVNVQPVFIEEETSSDNAAANSSSNEPEAEKEPEIEDDINSSQNKKSNKDKKAKKESKKGSSKKETKKESEEEENQGPRVYHISKRSEDNMWQVKFAKGKRAVKLFKTQAEAMEYAKQLTDSNGGSIRVHSLKGKIRKA